MLLYSRRSGVWRLVASVCLSVCPCSKRKMARVIRTKVGTRIVHGRTSACTDPEVKRSNLNPNSWELTHSLGVNLHVDTTAHFSDWFVDFKSAIYRLLSSPSFRTSVQSFPHYRRCVISVTFCVLQSIYQSLVVYTCTFNIRYHDTNLSTARRYASAVHILSSCVFLSVCPS